MEKKCFVALLMVVVMMCACWTGVLAEDEERETFTSGDYEYALLDDGTVEITGYSGDAEELIIPDTLAGKKVTAIGYHAFFWSFSLMSVTIPHSITTIGDNAFYGCFSLTSVTIPDSVVSIGDFAFYWSALTTVTIPDSVEEIGRYSFASCSALKSIYVSPEHPYYSTIDGVLFRKADKAVIAYPAGIESSTYTIPQGIASIENGAFASCFLTSIVIPDSVTFIGDEAFSGLPDLTLTVPRNSYALEYAKANNIPYTYPDANDWLNN